MVRFPLVTLQSLSFLPPHQFIQPHWGRPKRHPPDQFLPIHTTPLLPSSSPLQAHHNDQVSKLHTSHHHRNLPSLHTRTEDRSLWSGPALPHSHVPLKGRYDTSYSLSGRVMWHSSYWTVCTNAGMVFWLNADNLELLSHNTNYAVSLIPSVNKYFCYFLFIYTLRREVRVLGG